MSTQSVYTNTTAVPESAHGKLWDLRSDTVTVPSPEMLQAMATCPVGDDVFGEDPTVNALESKVASLLGKEAAIFVASGTMANQIGLRCLLTQPPHSVVLDKRSHVYQHEAGGLAFHSQAQAVPVVPSNGKWLTVEDIAANVYGDDIHEATTTVIEIENTLAGVVHPIDEIERISAFAKENNLKMHLDGARLWNASAATGIPLSEYGKHFDTVSLCLSKSLGAPVGSVLVGTKDVIKKARHFRKLFGGGWRQAGILAAACIYAIDNVWPLLKDAAANAKRLSEGLGELGAKIMHSVDTNMVWVDFSPLITAAGLKVVEDVVEPLAKEANVRIMGSNSSNVVRIVWHYQVPAEVVDDILKTLSQSVAAAKARNASLAN